MSNKTTSIIQNRQLLFVLLAAQAITVIVLAADIHSLWVALNALIHAKILLILLNIFVVALIGHVLSNRLSRPSRAKVTWIGLSVIFLNGYFGLYLGEYLYASLPMLAGIYELVKLLRDSDEVAEEDQYEPDTSAIE